jgi:hypothetical protein
VQARTLEFYGQYGFADEMVEQGVKGGAAHLREGGEDGRGREVVSAGPDCSLRPGECRMPIRPHCGSNSESRPFRLGSDRGQHRSPLGARACTQAQPENGLEGFHRFPYGRTGWH